MTIAVACGLIILVLLVIMLLAGVPIAVALAVSSIGAILPVLDTGASVLTGAQRIFSGISVFSLLAIPFFILAGNLMNKGGIAIRLINLQNYLQEVFRELWHTPTPLPICFSVPSQVPVRRQLPPWVRSSALSKRKKAMTGISQQRLISLPLLPVF